MGKKTIFDKIWDKHLVHEEEGKPTLLYIDLHLIHEVTSPQAFEGLRESKRIVRNLISHLRQWIIMFQL